MDRRGQPACRQSVASRGFPLFFALSKTIGIALLPTNFMIELGVVGVLLLATRFARLGRRLVTVAIVLLVLCGFSPLGNFLMYPLESRFPPWDPARGAPDGIIVLGGPIDPDMSQLRGVPVVHNAADRIFAAVELSRRYPSARIVFTGGSANLVSGDAREGDYAATLLQSLGVPKERLIIERDSRNTWENAIFTKQLVNPKPGERWLLVTSGYHMPRSYGIFRKAGFAVEPYPVDWRVGNLLEFDTLSSSGLFRTDLAIREWIGLIAYRLAGRTGELLPGPAKD